MLLRSAVLVLAFPTFGALAEEVVSSPGPAASAVPATQVPAAMPDMEPMDRLLTCKAIFMETASRHQEAVAALTDAGQRAMAKQSALDQALAVAVLDEALPGAGLPAVRHAERASDKRQRSDILAYCRRIVGQYVDIQMRSKPHYLIQLKPSAQAVLSDLQTVKPE